MGRLPDGGQVDKMLTVVEDINPQQPDRWQDAAKIVVCQIFDSVDKVLGHVSTFSNSEENRRIVSSAGVDSIDEKLNNILEGLHLLDIQFEGMLNNLKWFSSDSMYWVEEWRILGSIAAAAGIQNSDLMKNALDAQMAKHPDFGNSASAGVLDSWMLREEITQTLIRKQTDYGPENISRFGLDGLLVRCHDKIARLKNLHLFRGGESANESVTDTYLDIIGYSAIGMMWERGWFLLPLINDSRK
jgi:hypothetical protein